MVLALKDMTIRGELRTNVEALIKILEHPDFMYVTPFLLRPVMGLHDLLLQ